MRTRCLARVAGHHRAEAAAAPPLKRRRLRIRGPLRWQRHLARARRRRVLQGKRFAAMRLELIRGFFGIRPPRILPDVHLARERFSAPVSRRLCESMLIQWMRTRARTAGRAGSKRPFRNMKVYLAGRVRREVCRQPQPLRCRGPRDPAARRAVPDRDALVPCAQRSPRLSTTAAGFTSSDVSTCKFIVQYAFMALNGYCCPPSC